MRPSYQWGPPEGYAVYQGPNMGWFWYPKYFGGMVNESNGPYPTKQAAISNCRKIVAGERAKEKASA